MLLFFFRARSSSTAPPTPRIETFVSYAGDADFVSYVGPTAFVSENAS